MSNGTGNYIQVVKSYRDDFVRMEPEFKAALPEHIDIAKFRRVAVSAIQSTDQGELMKADRLSIRNAVLRCAADGLMMDGREAALVIYKGQAQYLPMVRGIMRLARNSGEISKIVAQVVYERDEFEIEFVTDCSPIKHRPVLGDRGEMIGVYAVALLKDGVWTDPEWMTVDQVNLIRGRSIAYKNNKGPWLTDYEQMALKTVIKRAAKRWPSSTDALDRVLHSNDDEYSPPTVEHIDHETGEVVDLTPKTRASRTAQVLGSRAQSGNVSDALTDQRGGSDEATEQQSESNASLAEFDPSELREPSENK